MCCIFAYICSLVFLFQGYKPEPRKFVPRKKQKGKSKASNVERRKALVRGTKERQKLTETKLQEMEGKTEKTTKTKKTEAMYKNKKNTEISDEKSAKNVLDRFLKTS